MTADHYYDSDMMGTTRWSRRSAELPGFCNRWKKRNIIPGVEGPKERIPPVEEPWYRRMCGKPRSTARGIVHTKTQLCFCV